MAFARARKNDLTFFLVSGEMARQQTTQTWRYKTRQQAALFFSTSIYFNSIHNQHKNSISSTSIPPSVSFFMPETSFCWLRSRSLKQYLVFKNEQQFLQQIFITRRILMHSLRACPFDLSNYLAEFPDLTIITKMTRSFVSFSELKFFPSTFFLNQ